MSRDTITVIIDSDLEDLIPGFLENRKKDLLSLKDALGKRENETIQSIGHSLKGVGGGYGFDEISRLGAEVENSAKASNHDMLERLVGELDDYLNRIHVVFE